eukprot:12819669-Alexandrium_andersonii.AAC.1
MLECPQQQPLAVSDRHLHLVHDSCAAVARLVFRSGLGLAQAEVDKHLAHGGAHASLVKALDSGLLRLGFLPPLRTGRLRCRSGLFVQ